MNYIDKIKEILQKTKLVKNAEFFIALLIVGIIVSIAASTFLENDEKQEDNIQSEQDIVQEQKTQEDYLEQKLEDILSQIEGAGQVSVMITYESGTEIVPAYETSEVENTTEEKDGSGSIKMTKQSETNMKPAEINNQGNSSALILKERYPEIRGVIVVAQGASDASVEMELTSAVRTVLNIPMHKVKVCTKK